MMNLRLRALLRSACVATVAVAGLTLGAATAAAHSNLIDSSPADGDAVAELPRDVVLTFSDGVQPDYTEVAVLYDGETVDAPDPVSDGALVTQTLPPLPDGVSGAEVTVSFRIVSADGHPVDGTLSFTVEGASGEPTGDPVSSPDSGPPDSPPAPTETGGTDPAAGDSTADSAAGDSTEETSTATLVGIGAAVALAIMIVGFSFRRRARRDQSDTGDPEGPVA